MCVGWFDFQVVYFVLLGQVEGFWDQCYVYVEIDYGGDGLLQVCFVVDVWVEVGVYVVGDDQVVVVWGDMVWEEDEVFVVQFGEVQMCLVSQVVFGGQVVEEWVVD